MVSPKQQRGRGHLPGDGGVPCAPSALLLRSHGNPRPRRLHPDADFSSLSTEIRGTKRNKTIRQCLQGSARSHSSRADLPLPQSHAEANAGPVLGCFSLLPLYGGNRTGCKTPAQLNSPPSPRVHPTGTTTTEPRPTALLGCPAPGNRPRCPLRPPWQTLVWEGIAPKLLPNEPKHRARRMPPPSSCSPHAQSLTNASSEKPGRKMDEPSAQFWR